MLLHPACHTCSLSVFSSQHAKDEHVDLIALIWLDGIKIEEVKRIIPPPHHYMSNIRTKKMVAIQYEKKPILGYILLHNKRKRGFLCDIRLFF